MKNCVICGKEHNGRGKTCSRRCNVILGNRTKKLDPNYSKKHSENARKGWKNISQESKQKHSEGISHTCRNRTLEERARISKINSESKILKWNNMTQEEKDKINSNRGRNNSYLGKNSNKEQIIINFIENYLNKSIKIIRNTRRIIKNPKTNKYLELDIYIPDYNLAIEYNGNYYHNIENPVKENLKTELCKMKGIKLIHVWECKFEDGINEIKEFIDNIGYEVNEEENNYE